MRQGGLRGRRHVYGSPWRHHLTPRGICACLTASLLLWACAAPVPAAPSPNLAGTVQAQVDATLAAAPPPSTATPTSAAATPTIIPAEVPTAVPTLSLEDAISRVKQATVLVVTDQGSGSGVSVGHGEVLTDAHVITGARSMRVRFADGSQAGAAVERADTIRDLALLRTTQTGEPTADFRASADLRSGDSLVAIGYPRPDAIGVQDMTVTRGIFSARWQSPVGVWYVQTDAAVNPGNSGGPLADEQGRVVGLVDFLIRGAVGLNYAVAADEIDGFRQEAALAPTATSASACSSADLAIADASLGSATASPGGSITLNYAIQNGGDTPTSVVLGASIRPSAGGTWRPSDPADDQEVPVSPGRNVVSRVLRVPPTTPAGSYDVAWGLYCSGDRTSHGFSVGSRALTIAGTGPEPTSATASDPVSVVEQFYALLSAKDFDAAWSLLSPGFRGATDESAWESGYATSRSVQVTDSQVQNQSDTTATVAVAIAAVDATESGLVTHRFQGTWTLVRSNGAWLLDSATIHQV